MKRSRISGLLVLVVLLTLVVVGCAPAAPTPTAAPTATAAPEATATTAPEATPTTAATTDKLYIPVISKGFQHQFWQAVKSGADKAAAEFDVDITFEGPETEADVAKQIDMIETALSKNPSALCLAALDSKAALPQLERCKQAGIPVIGFDSGVDSDIPVTTCATDNVAAAALAADKMAELIGKEGKIAVLVHDQTSRTGIDRLNGFTDRIKATYPNIQIIDTQFGGGDQLKSTEIAKAVMSANPDLKGYFGANEGSAIGVLNAKMELKNTTIVVIGYDSGKAQIDAIKAGTMAGAIQQDPVSIGYNAVKAAVDAKAGKTVPKVIDTGFKWADKNNIDTPEIQAILYQ